jgi:hypothetical protein
MGVGSRIFSCFAVRWVSMGETNVPRQFSAYRKYDDDLAKEVIFPPADFAKA